MKSVVKNFWVLWAFVMIALKGVQAQPLYFPPNTGNTWDTLSPSALGWCQPRVDSLYAYLDRDDTKAFILLKDGKIVLERYFGTFTRDSLWYWASAGKTLTAFTVGIAQQEGYLSLDDTTSQYLGTGWTACPPAKEEKITIWNQLTMTSGLDDGVPDHYCTLDTCLQYLADAGTRWAYHNGPYTLLDGVVSAATGQTLNAYFNAKIRTPIGMNGLFVQSGYNNVYVSNARSMARFGLLMLAKGTWNNNLIMTDTAYFNQMVNTSQSLNNSYGYLWWLNGKQNHMLPGLQFVFPGSLSPLAPPDMYAALGKNGQFINVVPSQNLVWIRMGNAPTSADVPHQMVDSIWKRINELTCSTSMDEGLSENVEMFPNPARIALNLCIQGEFKMDAVEWYQPTGKLIEKVTFEPTDKIALDVPPGTFGLLFLKIQTDRGVVMKRVLVNP